MLSDRLAEPFKVTRKFYHIWYIKRKVSLIFCAWAKLLWEDAFHDEVTAYKEQHYFSNGLSEQSGRPLVASTDPDSEEKNQQKERSFPDHLNFQKIIFKDTNAAWYWGTLSGIILTYIAKICPDKAGSAAGGDDYQKGWRELLQQYGQEISQQ